MNGWSWGSWRSGSTSTWSRVAVRARRRVPRRTVRSTARRCLTTQRAYLSSARDDMRSLLRSVGGALEVLLKRAVVQAVQLLVGRLEPLAGRDDRPPREALLEPLEPGVQIRDVPRLVLEDRAVHRLPGEVEPHLRIGHQLAQDEDLRPAAHLAGAKEVQDRRGSARARVQVAQEVDELLMRHCTITPLPRTTRAAPRGNERGRTGPWAAAAGSRPGWW